MNVIKSWTATLLFGLVASAACRHSGEPSKSGLEGVPDAGTQTDEPGLSPDTGAPIGPIATPAQLPPGTGGQGGIGSGPAPVGGVGATGGVRVGSNERKPYAL